MKSKFKGYYKPNQEDLIKIWDECIFVFDTNVLFDFYRYSDDTVELLFTIFEQLKDRIWIPHWVGLEYHRGLEERIKEQVDKYTSAIKDLSSFSDKIKSQREHPFISAELQIGMQTFYEKYNSELNTQKQKLKQLIIDNPVKEKIATLIGDNIGDPLSTAEIEETKTKGDERLPNCVPPGYIDYKIKIKRPGLDKYGDYIIWQQIIKKSISAVKPYIFVTFDQKEDWFKIITFNNSKLLVGPRPELIEEFAQTSEKPIWFYTTTDFIDYAVNHFKLDIEESKLTKLKEESKAILEEDKEINASCISDVKNENESNENNENIIIGATSSNSAESFSNTSAI